MRTKIGARLAAPLFVLALCSSACAPSIRSATAAAVSGATPAATQAGLEVMEDARTRQRIADVMGTPELQRAIGELTGGVIRGATDEIASEMPSMLPKISLALKANMSELEKGAKTMTHDLAETAFAEATSPEHQRAMQQMVSGMTGAMLQSVATELQSSVAPSLHRAIADDIGPMLSEAMRKDVIPAMAAMMSSPEITAAIGATTREIARQAVLGSNQALAELAEQRKHHEAPSTPLATLSALLGDRWWLFAVLVANVVLAIPIIWLIKERRKSKKYREEAEQRANRATALIAAMEAEGASGKVSDEVLAMLREQLLEQHMAHDSKLAVKHV